MHEHGQRVLRVNEIKSHRRSIEHSYSTIQHVKDMLQRNMEDDNGSKSSTPENRNTIGPSRMRRTLPARCRCAADVLSVMRYLRPKVIVIDRNAWAWLGMIPCIRHSAVPKGKFTASQSQTKLYALVCCRAYVGAVLPNSPRAIR